VAPVSVTSDASVWVTFTQDSSLSRVVSDLTYHSVMPVAPVVADESRSPEVPPV
jgi:hypothetical protein